MTRRETLSEALCELVSSRKLMTTKHTYTINASKKIES